MIKQGFWYSKLCQTCKFKRFVIRHRNIFNRYTKNVKQHIKDGISLPVCVSQSFYERIVTILSVLLIVRVLLYIHVPSSECCWNYQPDNVTLGHCGTA